MERDAVEDPTHAVLTNSEVVIPSGVVTALEIPASVHLGESRFGQVARAAKEIPHSGRDGILRLGDDMNTAPKRPRPVAERSVECVFCHALISLTQALKTRGVCAQCVREIEQLAWRVVYDRDRGIGEIPANLKHAYGL